MKLENLVRPIDVVCNSLDERVEVTKILQQNGWERSEVNKRRLNDNSLTVGIYTDKSYGYYRSDSWTYSDTIIPASSFIASNPL